MPREMNSQVMLMELNDLKLCKIEDTEGLVVMTIRPRRIQWGKFPYIQQWVGYDLYSLLSVMG
jgi:hypothetical protein